MKLISHRGNIHGPDKGENSPEVILKAIDLGYDVEVDVWKVGDNIFLGHDKADYMVEKNFLFSNSSNLWCHAKNLDALEFMIRTDLHCFWHESDDFTLTSKNFVWTFPKKPVVSNSVIVCKTLEESLSMSQEDIYGICTDYVGEIE